MLVWVLLAVVGLLTALYWYLTLNYDYWRSRGVYCLPGIVPGAGHFWDAITLKKSVHWIYVDLYHQLKNHPAVGLYQFRQPILLVKDLDLVQAVLISDFSSFHDNKAAVSEKVEPYFCKNPFVLKGEVWRTTRQILAPGFSQVKTKAMFPTLLQICKEFNKYMDQHVNEISNVNEITGLFTCEAVAKCAFGFDGKTFTDPSAEFVNQGRKMSTAFWNPLFMLFLIYFPQINKYFLKKSIMPNDVTSFIVSLVNQVWDFRQKNPEQATKNDYLQFLFSLHKKNPEFTMEDVIGQTLTFFTDGHETTAMVISYCLYELTINPEIQEELRRDIKSMDSFSYENITTLPLLDRVVQETLRKYSVISFIRECTKDTVLKAAGRAYPVEKGQRVIIPVHGIHHDPDIFPDPEAFNPDRFLPENAKNLHPVAFLGFSAGPRVCIGYKFATQTFKVFLVNILSNFRLVKCEKTVEKIKMNPVHFVPVSEHGIYVTFQRL